ncbi:MAG: L,D-transpeptidase, partial [Prochlorococcaceae cyanobacterium]
MSPERFQDRWEAFKGEPQQVSGVWTLYDAIRALPGGTAVLDEQAAWALKFSEKPPEPAWPVAFDPSGADEAGMVGPKKKAMMQKNDSYLLVNDRDEDMEAYDAFGKLLWKIPCLARGQGSDTSWRNNSEDTPPGLYKCGQLYDDYATYGPNPSYDGTLQSYGFQTYDLVELEGQEAAV